MNCISRQWVRLSKEAVAQSVEHWKRMMEWAEMQDLEEQISSVHMKMMLGENWYAEDCPLCQQFLREGGGKCGGCPLFMVFGSCEDKEAMNAWIEVVHAKDWEEWLEGAEVMLEQLKTVLMFLEEEKCLK